MGSALDIWVAPSYSDNGTYAIRFLCEIFQFLFCRPVEGGGGKKKNKIPRTPWSFLFIQLYKSVVQYQQKVDIKPRKCVSLKQSRQCYNPTPVTISFCSSLYALLSNSILCSPYLFLLVSMKYPWNFWAIHFTASWVTVMKILLCNTSKKTVTSTIIVT